MPPTALRDSQSEDIQTTDIIVWARGHSCTFTLTEVTKGVADEWVKSVRDEVKAKP